MIPEFDNLSDPPDDLVDLLPNFEMGESSTTFVSNSSFRRAEEVLPLLDESYCLHWALEDARLHLAGTKALRFHPRVIAHRHTFEWLFHGGRWSDVYLDT